MAHDGFLFGDPLFWAKTAQINSEGRNVRGLAAMIGWMWQHFLGQAALLPLAGAAVFVLVSRRRWQLAVGLAGVIVGITAFFIVSGARGTFLSSRYLVPIDLGLLFAAAIGVSALDVPAIRRWAGRRIRPSVRRVLMPIVGGLAVALAIAPMWPLDPSVRASVVNAGRAACQRAARRSTRSRRVLARGPRGEAHPRRGRSRATRW